MSRCVVNLGLVTGFEGEMAVDLRAGPRGVDVPTLVAAGGKDPITPLGAAEEIVASVPGDVTSEVFHDAAHFIRPSEPERFFSVVRGFITN